MQVSRIAGHPRTSESGIGAQSIGSGVVPWAQWSPSASLDRWIAYCTHWELDALGFVAANVCKLTQTSCTGTCPETSQRTVSISGVKSLKRFAMSQIGRLTLQTSSPAWHLPNTRQIIHAQGRTN
jgi:hypothetical protein